MKMYKLCEFPWNFSFDPVYLTLNEIWDVQCPLQPCMKTHRFVYMARCDSIESNYEGYDFFVVKERHIQGGNDTCERHIMQLDMYKVSVSADRKTEIMQEQLQKVLKSLMDNGVSFSSNTDLNVYYVIPKNMPPASLKPLACVDWTKKSTQSSNSKSNTKVAIEIITLET